MTRLLASLLILSAVSEHTAARPNDSTPVAPVRCDWMPIGARCEIERRESGAEKTVFTRLLNPPAADMTRVSFIGSVLPEGVVIRVTSAVTTESAEMDAAALSRWNGYSPLFNGDKLLIEVISRPPHADGLVVLATVASISDGHTPNTGLQLRDLCGTDDRIRDNTTAVARLNTGGGRCTASLIMTGEHMVSAGHCGPLGATALVEFDPPDSTSGGFTVAAPPERQFPFVIGSELRDNDFTYRTCGINQCVDNYGDDALVFRVAANTSGQLPGIARAGYMRITRASPSFIVFLRKWGCGVNIPESGTSNLTMKRIDVGAVTPSNLDGGHYWTYSQDTTGGDSGGPMIWTSVNASIGVTSVSAFGDCPSASYSFESPSFTALVESAVSAATTRFVDGASINVSGLAAGTVWNPQQSFRPAYDVVPTSGRVIVAPGSYLTNNGVLSRPCTVAAPFGGVTLTR